MLPYLQVLPLLFIALSGSQSASQTKIEDLKRHELAFVRDGDLWFGRADGSKPHLIATDAQDPAWSPDGNRLAYRQGRGTWIRDFGTGKTTKVATTRKPIEGIREDLASQMSFDPVLPYLMAVVADQVRVIDLRPGRIGKFDTILGMRLNSFVTSVSWSRRGDLMAVNRMGDLWLAKRDLTQHRIPTANRSLDAYDDANRLAALAIWNDGEVGLSGRTPHMVDEMDWNYAGTRVLFHFQRYGGSGVSEVGWVDLEPAANDESWETFSGFRVKVNWIPTDDLGLVFCPRFAADGQTITFIGGWDHFDTLYATGIDGKGRTKLMTRVEAVEWRPRQKPRP